MLGFRQWHRNMRCRSSGLCFCSRSPKDEIQVKYVDNLDIQWMCAGNKNSGKAVSDPQHMH